MEIKVKCAASCSWEMDNISKLALVLTHSQNLSEPDKAKAEDLLQQLADIISKTVKK